MTRRKVKAPNGDEWIVQRRLSRKGGMERTGLSDGVDAGLEGLVEGRWVPGIDFDENFLVSIALIVGYVIFAALAVLVIGLALQIVLPVLLAIYGLFATLALRRPWLIEAVDLFEPERSVAFPVRGWRRSGEAVKALAREIEATGSPGMSAAVQPQ